jgi:cytochrome P450
MPNTMDVDFYVPEIIADPWPLLKQIREAGPLVWNERGHWMTAHDLVCRQVLNRAGPLGQEGMISAFFGDEAFISIDDRKRHNDLRNVWAAAFGPKSLAALLPAIQRFTEQLLDGVTAGLQAGGSVDIMASFCRPLPAYVISFMMGIRDSMLREVVEWSDLMANASSGGFPIDYDHDPAWLAGERAKAEFADFLHDQIKYRRTHPGTDLISQIVHSEIGKTLPDQALMVNTRQLLFGGHETTAKWLGHIIATLGRNPDVRRELVETPSLMPAALDEVMRWEPVTHTLPRGVHGHDVVVADVPLKDGAEVILLLGGANRDPERYDEPERFNIHRERKGNLGFGLGLHTCLGNALAQAEATEATSQLLHRFPDYRLVEPVQYSGFNLRGPGSLYLTAS